MGEPVNFRIGIRLSNITGKLLDSVKLIKRFMDPSLKRVEIEEAGIRGTLFIPPGEGPFPAVIDFSGTGGGINEQKVNFPIFLIVLMLGCCVGQ